MSFVPRRSKSREWRATTARSSFYPRTRSPSPIHKYRLVYFDTRGRAEPIRQLFVIAGTPFEQLPFLDYEGVLLAQTHSIIRFLAKKFGYVGETALEEAIADSLSERFRDFMNEIEPYMRVMGGFASGNPDKLVKSCLAPASYKFFKCIEIFLRKAQTGFLVGRTLTYVDLLVSETIATLADRQPSILDAFPDIEDYIRGIRKTPRLKEWLLKRPASSW